MNHSSRLTLVVLVLAGALYSMFDIMSGQASALSVALIWVGIVLCGYVFYQPAQGVFVLAVTCFYGDYYKKLAVVYGVASMETVIEVLAVNLAILCAILLGSLRKLKGSGLAFQVWCYWLLVGVFVGYQVVAGDTLKAGLMEAANSSLYFALSVSLGLFYYRHPEKMSRVFCWMIWLTIPYVLLALYQYYVDFFEMDWVYAKTFLSPVYSGGMLGTDYPRVFGFAGTPFGFGGATSMMGTYALWHTLRFSRKRVFYGLCFVLLFFGVVISEQRTILILPFGVLICGMIFCSKRSTLLLYAVAVMLQVGLIAGSPYLLEKLNMDVSMEMQSEEDWSGRVMRLGTFSDRLYGWSRLTRASSYSWFGTGGTRTSWGDEDYYHDRINVILMRGGVVGLAAFLLIGFWLLSMAHRYVFQIKEPGRRGNAAFMLALLLVNLMVAIMTGGHLSSNPWNLLLALPLGYVLAVALNKQLKVREVKEVRTVPESKKPAFKYA
jgi:O-Antigen ligase